MAREAVRLSPYDPNCLLGMAEALSLSNDDSGADEALKRAIRIAPNSTATWVTASVVALGAKNWRAAIDACHRALELNPNDYSALNNLGVALRASGRRREGTEALARAAALDPDRSTARRNLSRRGIGVVRVIVLIVLFPIVFIGPDGLILYLACSIGSNVLISARPDLVLRAERWAAPVALFVGRLGMRRRPRRAESSSSGAAAVGEWSALNGRQRLRPWIQYAAAATVWIVVLVTISVALASPGYDKLVMALVAGGFAAIAVIISRSISQEHRRTGG